MSSPLTNDSIIVVSSLSPYAGEYFGYSELRVTVEMSEQIPGSSWLKKVIISYPFCLVHTMLQFSFQSSNLNSPT